MRKILFYFLSVCSRGEKGRKGKKKELDTVKENEKEGGAERLRWRSLVNQYRGDIVIGEKRRKSKKKDLDAVNYKERNEERSRKIKKEELGETI
jgi:hypothetical protein